MSIKYIEFNCSSNAVEKIIPRFIVIPILVGFVFALIYITDFSKIDRMNFFSIWIASSIGWIIGESIGYYARYRKSKIDNARIIDVRFSKGVVEFYLNDNKKATISLSALPNLKKASKKAKDSWELIAGGLGVHWKSTDDDILLHDNILKCSKSIKKRYSIKIVKMEKEKV